MHHGRLGFVLAVFLASFKSEASANQTIFKAYAPSPDFTSCKHWNVLRAQGDVAAAPDEAWVFGFASATNLFWDHQEGMEYRLSNNALLSEVDQACQGTGQVRNLTDVVVDVLHRHIENSENAAGR